MRTIADIRHDRLMELIQECGGVQTLADRLGKQHSQIQQLKNRAAYGTAGGRRAVGTTLAREIETKLGKPVGWMDTDPTLCCTGGAEPAEYRQQTVLTADAGFKMAVWRGAAMRLIEHCNAAKTTLDSETFADLVDAAAEAAGEEAAAVDKTVRAVLSAYTRGRGRALGHAQP